MGGNLLKMENKRTENNITMKNQIKCQSVREPERKIPVAASVDVLVLGGGPAGVCAAVTAGREGVRTMLIEQFGDVGGIATVGMMSHWTGKTHGGIYEEILTRSNEAERVPHRGMDEEDRKQIINPEKLKTELLKMLLEAGVDVRLYVQAVAPLMEGNTIIGVITESKSGREAILAKIVIDSTGDGDIAARAGVPFELGRETDHKMQPASIMFKVGGVDTDRAVFPSEFEDNIPLYSDSVSTLRKEGIQEIGIQDLGKKKLPFPAGHVLLYRSSMPTVVTCNMTNCLDVDGTKAKDLTRATIVCREQMNDIVSFLQKYVPGFENCFLLTSASMIGIRETRHFYGEEVITEEDIRNARVFDDWVVTKAWFNFDVHNMSGNGLDSTGEQKKFSQNKGYTIPYGCFVPKVVDNLYLAGRDISGTHMAHSNYRVMPICANMGEAVGVAASLCVRQDISPRDLDVKSVQKRLMELGVTP